MKLNVKEENRLLARYEKHVVKKLGYDPKYKYSTWALERMAVLYGYRAGQRSKRKRK